MVLASLVALHGGSVTQIAFPEYVFRVLLSVFAFGCAAVAVHWGLELLGRLRSRIAAEHDP